MFRRGVAGPCGQRRAAPASCGARWVVSCIYCEGRSEGVLKWLKETSAAGVPLEEQERLKAGSGCSCGGLVCPSVLCDSGSGGNASLLPQRPAALPLQDM